MDRKIFEKVVERECLRIMESQMLVGETAAAERKELTEVMESIVSSSFAIELMKSFMVSVADRLTIIDTVRVTPAVFTGLMSAFSYGVLLGMKVQVAEAMEEIENRTNSV